MKDIFSDVTHNEEGLSCGQFSTIISKLEVQLLKIYSGYNYLPNQIVKKGSHKKYFMKWYSHLGDPNLWISLALKQPQFSSVQNKHFTGMNEPHGIFEVVTQWQENALWSHFLLKAPVLRNGSQPGHFLCLQKLKVLG